MIRVWPWPDPSSTITTAIVSPFFCFVMRTPRIVRPSDEPCRRGNGTPCPCASRPVHPSLKDVWDGGPSGAGRPSPPGCRGRWPSIGQIGKKVGRLMRGNFVPSRSMAASSGSTHGPASSARPDRYSQYFASATCTRWTTVRSDKTVHELVNEAAPIG
jgi:hypothetical protein